MVMKDPLYGNSIHHMCVAKGAMENKCGKATVVDGATVNVCCCETADCNDAVFTTKCLDDA